MTPACPSLCEGIRRWLLCDESLPHCPSPAVCAPCSPSLSRAPRLLTMARARDPGERRRVLLGTGLNRGRSWMVITVNQHALSLRRGQRNCGHLPREVPAPALRHRFHPEPAIWPRTQGSIRRSQLPNAEERKMSTNYNLNGRWRQQPAHIARLQRYCLLRWIRARTAARSARWFAAIDRCARLGRLAAH